MSAINGDNLLDWIAELHGWRDPTRPGVRPGGVFDAAPPGTLELAARPAPIPIRGLDGPWGIRPATAGILRPADEVHDHDAVYTVAELGVPIVDVWVWVGGQLQQVFWRADRPLYVSRPLGWDDEPAAIEAGEGGG